ncbi:hypothetical protein MHU86_2921 [Fragilaria crotonensis]|nr:hypothetical protein MHU86_2921 [Fragilaria crotonensis]
MVSSTISNDAPVMPYPRTGKRGVPQQFPRRLSEMLDSEAHLAKIDPHHQNIISWSDSGKAFRIANVSLFSSRILPKYFRTSKFSSFQRNLNLYGFCKVRRGPDTDMYAHPAFARGQPETLSQLRKCNSSGTKKSLAPTAATEFGTVHRTPNSPSSVTPSNGFGSPRDIPLVAPRMTSNGYPQIAPHPTSRLNLVMTPILVHTHWHNSPHEIKAAPTPVSPGGYDSGRLDLLALALTSMAERDASITGMNATAIETA